MPDDDPEEIGVLVHIMDADEFFADIQDQVAQANAAATEEQKQIGWGDYFVRDYHGPNVGASLWIFGSILTRQEVIDKEQELGADQEELGAIMQRLDHGFAQGFRYGWCYSIVEPEGELGSTHIAGMIRISKAEFDWARFKGWSMADIAFNPGPWKPQS